MHTDDQVSVPLEAALRTGRLNASAIMASAKPANCLKDARNATFHLSTSLTPNPTRASEREITIGRYTTDIENGAY